MAGSGALRRTTRTQRQSIEMGIPTRRLGHSGGNFCRRRQKSCVLTVRGTWANDRRMEGESTSGRQTEPAKSVVPLKGGHSSVLPRKRKKIRRLGEFACLRSGRDTWDFVRRHRRQHRRVYADTSPLPVHCRVSMRNNSNVSRLSLLIPKHTKFD